MNDGAVDILVFLKKNKPLTLIYIKIIPILIQVYRIDIENEDWTANKNIEFLKEVAADLQEKANLRISSLE